MMIQCVGVDGHLAASQCKEYSLCMKTMQDSYTPSEAPYLVSLKEAAYLLGVSTRTVKYMVQRGELPVVRIGRRTLVSRAALRSLAGATI